MADGARIGLELHLSGKENVKKSLEEIFKYAEQNKNLKINIDPNTLTSIKTLNEAITNLSKQIEELNKQKINIVGNDKSSTNNIKEQTKAVKELTNAKKEEAKASNQSNTSNTSNKSNINAINEEKKALEELNNIKSKNSKSTVIYNYVEDENGNKVKNILKTINEVKLAYENVLKIQTDMQTGGQTFTHSINTEKQKDAIDKLNRSMDETLRKLNELKNTGFLSNDIFNNASNTGIIDKLKSLGDINPSNFKEVKNVLTDTSTQIKQMESDVKSIDKMTSKLEEYKKIVSQIQNTGLFNKGVFDGNSKMKGFTEKLSSIDFSNVENAKKQMDNLGKSISQLEANGKRINSLQKSLDNLRSGFNNLRTGDNKDIFATLDTSKVEEFKKSLEAVSNIMKRTKANSGTVNDLEITKALDNAQQKLKGLEKDFAGNLGVDKLINKINTAFANLDKTNLSSDFITNMQNKLNSLDTSTPRKQLEELFRLLNSGVSGGGIKGNSSKIEDIQKKIDSTVASITKLRNNNGIEIVDKNSAVQLENVNKELSKLENIKSRLSNGEIIKSSEISNVVNSLNNAMNGLNNSVKSNSGIESLINKVKTAFNNLDTSRFNNSFLASLQNQINSINFDTPKEKLQELYNLMSRGNEYGGIKNNALQFTEIERAIEKIRSSLEALRGKYGIKLVDEKSSTQLSDLYTELSKLEQIKTRLSNGEVINSSQIKGACNEATNAMSKLTNATKYNSDAMKMAQQDAISFGQSLQRTLSKFGIYASLATAMRKVFSEFREGVEYVKSVDEAFFNLSATMDITRSSFDKMLPSIQGIAKQMGTDAQQVMDVVKVYANASTNINDVIAKSKPTIAFANISGMNTEEVTKATNSILNQFQLLEDGSVNVTDITEKALGTLVTVSQNMQYDFGEGLQQLIEGIKESGSVIKQTGGDLEWFTSILGSAIEQSGVSGSEFANSMRFIAARATQIKGIADESEVTSEDMAKAEKALNNFNIAVRDSGGIRNLPDILQDIADKWQTMSRQDQSQLGEALAG